MRVIWKRRVWVGTVYLNLHSVQPNSGPPDVQPFTVSFTPRGAGFRPNPCAQANPDPPDDEALPVSIQLIFDGTGALTEVGATVGVSER